MKNFTADTRKDCVKNYARAIAESIDKAIDPPDLSEYDKTEDAKAREKIIAKAIDSHTSDRSNPHDVTAEQVGAYTKEETDKIIADAEENFMKNHGLIYDKGVVYFG